MISALALWVLVNRFFSKAFSSCRDKRQHWLGCSKGKEWTELNLDRWEHLLVIVVCQDPPSVVVQDGDGLHGVKGGGLEGRKGPFNTCTCQDHLKTFKQGLEALWLGRNWISLPGAVRPCWVLGEVKVEIVDADDSEGDGSGADQVDVEKQAELPTKISVTRRMWRFIKLFHSNEWLIK